MDDQAMVMQKLELGTLHNFDGGYLEAVINDHIKQIAADLYDRPGIPKPRTLTLQMKFKPILAANGQCDGVTLVYEIKNNTPKTISKIVALDIKPSSVMFFRGLSPEDPAQQLLPMEYSQAAKPTDDGD